MGKLRTHATPGVSSLAKEVVKLWKDAVEESKKRRKRDDGDEKDSAAKRVKREDSEWSRPRGETALSDQAE